MLEIARKVKQASGGKITLSITAASTVVQAILGGADIVSALGILGIGATAGVSQIVAQLGRATIKRMIKKVGRRKAAIW